MKTAKLVVFDEAADVLEKLEDAPAGKLIKRMIQYFRHGTDEGEDDLVWTLIKGQISRSKDSYDRCVENGKKGGRPKKYEEATKDDDEEVPFRDYKYKPSRYPIQ